MALLDSLDEAEATYRELTQTQPRAPRGWRGLARVARQRGDRLRSLEYLRKAFELQPGNREVAAEIAHDLRSLGRLDEAEAISLKLAQTQPQSPHGWRGLAQVARRRGDRARALEQFRKALELDPGNGGIAGEIASELRGLGRLDEAATICGELAQTQPQSPHGWRGLAQVARQRGDRVRALDQFRKALGLDPDNGGIAGEIASELRALGRLDEAEAVSRELTRKNLRSGHGWRALAQVARQRGERARSLRYLRKAFHLEPGDCGLAGEIVGELRELGRLDEAEAFADAFRAAFPRSAQALIHFANSRRRKISKFELIRLLEQAVELEPEAPGPRMALASEFMACWRLEDAEALYDRALAENQNFVPALLGKGRLWRRRGDWLRAIACHARAAEVEGDREENIVEYARTLIDAGAQDDALTLLHEAVARCKTWGRCHLLLGLVARDRGLHDLVKPHFDAACEASPVKDQAWVESALEEYRRGDSAAAVERMRRLLRERPTFVRAYEVLADIAEVADDLEGALDLLETGRKIDSSKPNTWIRIARLQARLGRLEESEASFADCARWFGALPEAETAKAALLRHRGDHEAARRVLRTAASMFPGHFALWRARVASCVDNGDFDGARELFETCPAGGRRERAFALLARGQWALAQWRLEEAAERLEAALELLPTDSAILNEAVRCALLRNDLEAAVPRLKAATEFNARHRVLRHGGQKPIQTHEGQLLDEYRLDVSALSRLRAGAVGANPVAQLSELVIEAPDYTPAAIGLMVALRRQGLLTRGAKAPRSESLIPRRIAQFWDDDIPPDVRRLCQSWRDYHPDFAYTLFSTDSAARFLMDKGAHQALAAFMAAREPAMKADIFRLAYLHYEGGYYLDADDRCVSRLDGLDPGACELLVYQENYGTMGNNFIGVVPRHPAIGLALRGAVEALARGDSDLLWLSTGPGLLTRAVAQYLAEDLAARLNNVWVLERHELARSVAMHCLTSYKFTSKHWSRTSFPKLLQTRVSVRDALAMT